MTQFQPFLESLDPGLKTEILEHLKANGPAKTTAEYFEKLGVKKTNLYPILLREYKKSTPTSKETSGVIKSEGELTEDDLLLLERFKRKELGFDEMHRELAIRAFKKILIDPRSIKVRDWLQSELVKIKKDDNARQADAMRNLVDQMFSGFIPSEKCPHCGQSTLVKKEDIVGTEISDDSLAD